MVEWWKLGDKATFPRVDGALRTIAELFFGGQNEQTIREARGWLRRRSYLTTGTLLELIARKVYPRMVVEKSPSIVYRMTFLRRAYRMFPNARFIHLLRHPRSQGESVIRLMEWRRRVIGEIPATHWFYRVSTRRQGWWPNSDNEYVDPQRGWYELHQTILTFLKSVPERQKFRIHGEDLLIDPNTSLKQISQWLGIRTDLGAIESCKHPENSPYACLGPKGAIYGNDRLFLENPVLRPQQAKPCVLEGSLSWRKDKRGFAPAVKRLASQLGYS